MSLEDDLLKDLESDLSDSESEVEDTVTEKNGSGSRLDENGDVEMDMVGNELDQLKEAGHDVTTLDLIDRLDLENIQDVTKLSKLQAKLRPIITKIDEFMGSLISKRNENDFLMSVNDVSLEITSEISLIHNIIKSQYSKRFPELESLITDPVVYVKVIKALGNDLEIKQEKLDFLTKEKVLVLTMSVLQVKSTSNLSETELRKLFSACDLLLELEQSRVKISDYISSRLAVFAPNLTAIVGSSTAAQLLSILGGLNTLAITPSCNIAGLGSRKNIGIGFGHSGVRQQGFLFYSDLIQSVSPSLRKQAMRIAAGKIVLAARIDLSNGSPDGALGTKWSKEIQEKIEKLEEPPEISKQKALPVPMDKPAKKRAGRRYRKLKQRFEASELRKAQNRVEFGKQESTIIDAYGEEVGLGMSGSLSRMPINVNTKAKVTKKMKNRLEATTVSEDFFNQDFINLPKIKESSPK